MQNLMNEIDGHKEPIHSLRIGYCYRYNGSDNLFSKTFIFRVVEDRFDNYLILVNELFATNLEKDFDLIDAVHDGVIEYLGSPDDIGLTLQGDTCKP